MKIKFSKILAVALAALIAACCFACTPSADEIRVYMPDGAPAIALSKFMHEGYADTVFTVVPNGEILRARVASGDADLAIMPINAAAALYNNGVKIKMLSVNTHCNLYIISKNADSADMEIADFVGSRLAVIGQADVPGLTFRMLFDKAEVPYETSKNAVDGKVAVTYAADGPAAIALLGTGAVDYALLAEPAVSNAVKKLGGRVVCDVQAMWKDAFGGSFPQACLVAKDTVSYEYINKFVAALSAADGWAENNPTEAVNAVKTHMETGSESSLAQLTAAMIKGCNIKTVEAYESKTACTEYFTALSALKKDDGAPVLSKVPDDGFYYDHIEWTT